MTTAASFFPSQNATSNTDQRPFLTSQWAPKAKEVAIGILSPPPPPGMRSAASIGNGKSSRWLLCHNVRLGPSEAGRRGLLRASCEQGRK